jgi:hypothetical protein
MCVNKEVYFTSAVLSIGGAHPRSVDPRLSAKSRPDNRALPQALLQSSVVCAANLLQED